MLKLLQLLFLFISVKCKPNLEIYDLESVASPTNYSTSYRDTSYVFNFRKILQDSCEYSDGISNIVRPSSCECNGVIGSETYDYANGSEGLVFNYSAADGSGNYRYTSLYLYCGLEVSFYAYERYEMEY
jgi:hypothetical protein